MYQPCDKLIEKEFKHIRFHDNPLFLHSNKAIEGYKKNTKHDKFQETFKRWSLKQLNIKGLDKSLDKENRKRITSDINTVPIVSFNKYHEKYIKEAEKYVKAKFKYLGESEGFEYPICHVEAEELFVDFCENRLKHYGDYQDYVHNERQVLYHSMISSSLNIGLLNVKWILQTIVKHQNKVSPNQYEAFMRQIVGWREYERYLYHFYYDEMITSNYFNNNRKLPNYWYKPARTMTGILPIDDIIRKVMRTAYMNHIERLMFILNYMTLSEVAYKDIYKWFMSVSIDAYDWIMVSNVSSMSYYYPHAMRKPYIAASNYIMKMSNYKRDAWCNKLDDMFYKFLKNKKQCLKNTIYVRLMK
eukprot:768660-Hanusia_phi.AAC.5